MEGIMKTGSPISLETVRVRRKVDTVRLGTTLHNITPPPPSPKSSELDLELKLWTGRTKPHQTPYALNGVAQGYLPRRGYRGRCAIHTSHPSLWFFVASSLVFELSTKPSLRENRSHI